ncbi:hypothetical protein HUJ04_013041 [Dendroctonus ponderosae]|nr:hypothetical protein HUJ04_013041 [Dendroctonus ponderosae]
MALVFISLVRTYQENSITFLTETTYLEWNTSFPSVSVCQISGADMSLIDQPFDQRDNKAMLEFFITDLLFFSGSCYACQYECFSCSKVNISKIIEKVYIHGPEEVPFINAESNYMKDILLGEHYEILFNVSMICRFWLLAVSKNLRSSNYSSSGITIEMQSLPTSRFKRVVVKNILDLVVSIGGAAGFFIGASLLTVVEIIYIYFIRT